MSGSSSHVGLIIKDVSITEIFYGDELYDEPGRYTLITAQATYDPRFEKLRIGDGILDLEICPIIIRSVKTREDFEKSNAQHGMVNIHLLETQFSHLLDILRVSKYSQFKLNFTANILPGHVNITRLKLGEMSLIHKGRAEPVIPSKLEASPTKKIENWLSTIATILGAIFIRMLLVK